MNKKVYEQPEVMVVTFEVTDVMLASANPGVHPDIFDGNNPFDGLGGGL